MKKIKTLALTTIIAALGVLSANAANSTTPLVYQQSAATTKMLQQDNAQLVQSKVFITSNGQYVITKTANVYQLSNGKYVVVVNKTAKPLQENTLVAQNQMMPQTGAPQLQPTPVMNMQPASQQPVKVPHVNSAKHQQKNFAAVRFTMTAVQYGQSTAVLPVFQQLPQMMQMQSQQGQQPQMMQMQHQQNQQPQIGGQQVQPQQGQQPQMMHRGKKPPMRSQQRKVKSKIFAQGFKQGFAQGFAFAEYKMQQQQNGQANRPGNDAYQQNHKLVMVSFNGGFINLKMPVTKLSVLQNYKVGVPVRLKAKIVQEISPLLYKVQSGKYSAYVVIKPTAWDNKYYTSGMTVNLYGTVQATQNGQRTVVVSKVYFKKLYQ